MSLELAYAKYCDVKMNLESHVVYNNITACSRGGYHHSVQ